MLRVALTLVFALPLAAAPVPKALKKQPPLNGTWEVTEWHIDEDRMNLSEVVRWTIEGETLTVVGTGPGAPAGFASNATRTISRPEGGEPTDVTYTITYTGGGRTDPRPAVLELDGDTFTICMSTTSNGRRPAGCKPVDGTITYTLKRVDPAK